jgi:hypothetical protein
MLFEFHAAKGRKKILHKKIFCIKSFLYLCPSLIVKQNTMETKTHFKKLRNPDYLGSWDLTLKDGSFGEITVTIKEVKKQMVFDGKGGQDECVVVTLADKDLKPFIANSTNLKMLARVCGSNFIEDWAGKQVVLGVDKVRAFGEIHDALRVRNKKPAPAKKDILTPEHPSFAKVKAAIESGAADIAQARSKFEITAEVEALLTGGAK